MNWYKLYKLAFSPMGVTLGKWLIQARNGPVDPFLLMQDSSLDLNDGNFNAVMQEAHQYLIQQTGQQEPYNNFQQAVVDAVRNAVQNPVVDNMEGGQDASPYS